MMINYNEGVTSHRRRSNRETASHNMVGMCECAAISSKTLPPTIPVEQSFCQLNVHT